MKCISINLNFFNHKKFKLEISNSMISGKFSSVWKLNNTVLHYYSQLDENNVKVLSADQQLFSTTLTVFLKLCIKDLQIYLDIRSKIYCLDEATGMLLKQVLFFLYIINYHRSLLSERRTKTQRWRKKGERREKKDEEKEEKWEKRKFFKNTSGVIATIKNIQIQ